MANPAVGQERKLRGLRISPKTGHFAHSMHATLYENAARDVEVEIYFLPTEHGGRQGPAFSGYRPQFYYDGRDWDAVHQYPDVAAVSPGQTVRAFLIFLNPHEHVEKLHPGKPFLIREGNRTVAYGTVKSILDLEASAKRLAGRDPA